MRRIALGGLFLLLPDDHVRVAKVAPRDDFSVGNICWGGFGTLGAVPEEGDMDTLHARLA